MHVITIAPLKYEHKKKNKKIKMTKKAFTYIAVLVTATLLIILFVKPTGKINYEDEDYTWNVVIGSSDGDTLVRGKKIDTIKSDINKLIYALNKSDQDPEAFRTPKNKEPIDPPKMKFIGIQDQVVNVEVVNATHLTQRMGTTGAEVFLAVATFTLTEYDNIKFVNLIFNEGDHAAPGLYSRKQFLRNWKVLE